MTGTLGGAAQSQWRRKVEPRVTQGRALRGRASAGMDLSDGLSLDLRRLCLESRVSADLNSAAIPVARGATLEQALHGGEDYELLFTASQGKRFPKLPVTQIGVITNGKPGEIRLDGNRLEPKGFDHFA